MPWRPLNRSVLLQSIRMRLTFWNTLVVLLAVITALVGVREGLRYYLVQELDDILDDEVDELLLVIRELYPSNEKIINFMERKSVVHEKHGWHIRWLDSEREKTIWVSAKNAPPEPLTNLEFYGNGRSTFVSDSHRCVERRLETPGVPAYYVRVGTTMENIERDVDRMTRVMAPIGLAIFLMAPLGGFFLANRAIDPLQRIITTTERLKPSRMEDRLVLRGVGDELDQLAYKINQFLDQIAEHLTKHREFLANAAHELRSPLTAIQSSVEVTLQRTRSSEDYQELLISIDEQCHHLGQLVNQVLELATSDAGVLEAHREPVRIDAIAQQACEMFEAVAEERGQKLECQTASPVTINGDPSQLRQLVTNLLDNAIKFTPHGGKISVDLKLDCSAQNALLTVSDSGIGMAPEDLPRIFDRFYRADKSRQRGSEIRGSGLGLSICHSIIRGHQGNIEVRSEPNRGTTFIVSLPVQQTKVRG